MSRNFIPDESLIDQLLLDDTSAFEELHHRYCYSLYTYCNGKLNSPEDAKSIVRDIFIALWENRHTLPVNFSVSLHLYSSVRKAVVQCLNQKLQDKEDISTIEQAIIPGFKIEQLQQARQFVQYKETSKKSDTITSAPVVNRRYEEQWWKHYSTGINLKGLKYAFQKVMHLF
jgi:DNA-directed RNA polymerase specialized sigma24 family protein